MSLSEYVDDTDPRLNLGGASWFSAPGPDHVIGNYGNAWNNTLHGTNTNNSISFSFKGVFVVLYTTVLTPSGQTPPVWQCFVDGVAITDIRIPYQPTNHWSTCGGENLNDGQHTFTANVTVAEGQTAYVDFVKFAPSSDVSLANQTVYVENFSPIVQNSNGWVPFLNTITAPSNNIDDVATSTNQTGSSAHIAFTGSSLAWYGIATFYVVNSPASCTYSIDGGTPIPFQTVGVDARSTTASFYYQLIFQTEFLPWGPHTIDVVYNGTPKDTPLILDYVIIQNQTVPTLNTLPQSAITSPGTTTSLPPSTSISSTSGAPAPSDTSGTSRNDVVNSNRSSSNAGAIGGGVGGGVALILILLVGFIFWRRMKRKAAQSHELASPHPFTPAPVTPASPMTQIISPGAASTSDIYASSQSTSPRKDAYPTKTRVPIPHPAIPQAPVGLSQSLAGESSAGASSSGTSRAAPLSSNADSVNPAAVPVGDVDEKWRSFNPSVRNTLEAPPPMYSAV